MCGGGGGEDGGYAARQAAMKAEQDEAINDVNAVFGRGVGSPVYQNVTTQSSPGMLVGYDDQGKPMYAGERTESTERVLTGYDPAVRDANLAARESLYGTIGKDAEARLLDNLGRDRGTAERDVRFQLARQGLMGGSADIDQGRELLEKFQEGSLEARNAATGAANQARSADEKTRVNLINNIRSGMSQSDALSSAFAGMQNSANEARDAAMGTNIGNFFNDLSLIRGQQQFREGMEGATSRYPRGTTSATSGGFGGTIRN